MPHSVRKVCNMDEKCDIRSLTYEELEEWVVSHGQAKFRAGQLFSWLHKMHVAEFDEMTNLSKDFREMLKRECVLKNLRIEECLISEIDGTRKYLFALNDDHIIESVFMRYHHGNSVCVSTQVGCRMGCRFCASTIDGLVRNLTASEILEQIYSIEDDTKERVSNVVLMGSGEPMDNYEQVSRFVTLISDPKGLNISKRNLTISTCGLIPGIRALMKDHPQVTLALSLHAPNNRVRKELMPVANAFALDEVLAACREYSEVTKRRVTFEYSLVKNVNDNEAEAKELASLLKGFPCHVNLIPVNPIEERDFVQSNAESIRAFQKILEKNGINVTIRREMGRDIQGACGQLRRRYLSKN